MLFTSYNIHGRSGTGSNCAEAETSGYSIIFQIWSILKAAEYNLCRFTIPPSTQQMCESEPSTQ